MSLTDKAILIIMDGWGLESDPAISAITAADTPFTDSLYEKYPHTTLLTYGEFVGLPDGQMGNSEVGHMNLGAGRIIWQDLLLIDKQIESGDFYQNTTLKSAFAYAREKNKAVHFIGLVSEGGVHSHVRHVKALVDMAQTAGVKQSYIHAFTDGRDTDPHSALPVIKDLENHLQSTPTKIASLCGRYFAMDRDKRWERVKKAYDLLIHGKGATSQSSGAAIEAAYSNGITDEFIEPVSIVNKSGKPIATIGEGDVVISFNFRTDRCREITTVLTQKDFPDYDMQTLPLYYVTMTIYDESFQGVKVAYGKDVIPQTLGEVISNQGLTQLRVAETEKYPHVTFFFSGGREKPFEGEERIMVNSPKVATYDLQPEMSAFSVRDLCIASIEQHQPDFICLNFANTDMVGHTGIFKAAMEAAATVDSCVASVVAAALPLGYHIFLTADHGNADCMINPDGSVNTAHSKNLVPLFYLHKSRHSPLKQGKLADIAPTILSTMNLPIPKEMTGEILLG